MNLSRSLLVLIGAAATVVACASPEATTEDTDTSDQDLQGGHVDSGHPAVGLVWFTGGGFCTGTLIAPSVILTAGHCVQDPIDGFYTGKGTATVTIGELPSAGFTKHAVDQMIAHPTYSAGGGCPNTTLDIGLIHLAAPLTGVTPLAIATSAAPATGTSCQAVGYGTHTSAKGVDTFESKRTGTETVKSAAKTSLLVTEGTAVADHGDSGGPLLCGAVIAGATSCHTDGDFPAHKLENYARVDAAATWIQKQIALWK